MRNGRHYLDWNCGITDSLKISSLYRVNNPGNLTYVYLYSSALDLPSKRILLIFDSPAAKRFSVLGLTVRGLSTSVLVTASCIVTGCTHVNVKRMTYEVLRQHDCRQNQLEDFCGRGFSHEYNEYERLRQEFIRSQVREAKLSRVGPDVIAPI